MKEGTVFGFLRRRARNKWILCQPEDRCGFEFSSCPTAELLDVESFARLTIMDGSAGWIRTGLSATVPSRLGDRSRPTSRLP